MITIHFLLLIIIVYIILQLAQNKPAQNKSLQSAPAQVQSLQPAQIVPAQNKPVQSAQNKSLQFKPAQLTQVRPLTIDKTIISNDPYQSWINFPGYVDTGYYIPNSEFLDHKKYPNIIKSRI